MTVRLTQGGKDLPAPGSSTRGTSTPITLVFDTTGSGVFPSAYKTLLQNVYNAAKPTMDLVFGQPSVGGNVRVVNFDAQIGDRQAVAGGYFLPNNGSGQMEIRFPVYSNPEAAAVNFIHTLLLAYLGPNAYAYDPFQEGLVRAATMKIVRTPSVLAAGLDPAQVELVLANSYDVGPFYDWYNQPALEGPTFIAPNLLNVPLPTGGSVGGPYLLKYRMGGSAWQKVLAQYPSFIARLNERFYAQPSIAANPTAILQAGQAALDQISGVPNSTVEGFTLAEWAKRQYILHAYTTRGSKILLEPTPITSGLSGSDFGVFLVETHYFKTTGANNEILLSGTSYPIFWEGNSNPNRVFPSAQEDRMDIAGAYSAVVPNLPNLNAGKPYRAIVDIPVGDQLERVYLPAGAVATATTPKENTFYGTVIGAPGTLHVKATVGSTVLADAPVTNGAFGVNVTNASFLNLTSVVVQVLQTNGTVDTVLYTRRVNKGPGSLAVDLRIGGEATFTPTVPKGLSALGFPLQPYIDHEPQALGTFTNSTLVARYNPSRASYDLFPEIEPFKIGHGYFVRMQASSAINVVGRVHPGMAMSVALKPGWNLISVPKMNAVTTGRVQVVHTTEFPKAWSEALGVDIGTDYFKFVPGPNDAASGAPETGSFAAVTDNTFQPGQAYYVRVLDPEGVTILFMPPSGSFTATSVPTTPTSTGWRMEAQLISSTQSSKAIFGASATSGYRFDKEDSGIPPSMGGLQVIVQGIEPMYRDIRLLGNEQYYKLHLEGLTAGQRYSLRLLLTQGFIPYCTVIDKTASYSKVGMPPTVYTFVATGSTRDITVYIPKGAR
jgi:hypothetical protein